MVPGGTTCPSNLAIKSAPRIHNTPSTLAPDNLTTSSIEIVKSEDSAEVVDSSEDFVDFGDFEDFEVSPGIRQDSRIPVTRRIPRIATSMVTMVLRLRIQISRSVPKLRSSTPHARSGDAEHRRYWIPTGIKSGMTK